MIATLRGSERPDEWVIRANHRDGWVFGAWDPLSGQTVMLEEAKAELAARLWNAAAWAAMAAKAAGSFLIAAMALASMASDWKAAAAPDMAANEAGWLAAAPNA